MPALARRESCFPLLAGVTALLAIGCSTPGRDDDPPAGGPDASKAVDARSGTIDAPNPIDAPSLQPTMFPITGSAAGSPVIAGVTVSCFAQYAPKIIRVQVLVTDPQGAMDRGTGSGTLVLPDGTSVALNLPEPFSASPYEHRVRFGTGENLTIAQFDQTCAAALLQLGLTIADKTGHVTLAPSVVVAPTVGGTL